MRTLPVGNNGWSHSLNRCFICAVKPATSRGFTLVEIMVVMVIIALVMGLVATSMSRSISGAEARAASRKLVASLRYTRARAIIDKKEQVFQVDTENRSYQAPGRETGQPA